MTRHARRALAAAAALAAYVAYVAIGNWRSANRVRDLHMAVLQEAIDEARHYLRSASGGCTTKSCSRSSREPAAAGRESRRARPLALVGRGWARTALAIAIFFAAAVAAVLNPSWWPPLVLILVGWIAGPGVTSWVEMRERQRRRAQQLPANYCEECEKAERAKNPERPGSEPKTTEDHPQ